MDKGPEPGTKPVVVDHRAPSRTGIGIVLLVIGALFFMDRLGWDLGWRWHPTFARMWPVLLIVLALSQLLSSDRDRVVTDRLGQVVRTRRGRSFAGFWWLAVGVIMLLDQNGWLTLQQSWPLFIIACGVSILLGQRRSTREGN